MVGLRKRFLDLKCMNKSVGELNPVVYLMFYPPTKLDFVWQRPTKVNLYHSQKIRSSLLYSLHSLFIANIFICYPLLKTVFASLYLLFPMR